MSLYIYIYIYIHSIKLKHMSFMIENHMFSHFPDIFGTWFPPLAARAAVQETPCSAALALRVLAIPGPGPNWARGQQLRRAGGGRGDLGAEAPGHRKPGDIMGIYKDSWGIFYPKYGKIYGFGGQEDRKQKTGRLGTDYFPQWIVQSSICSPWIV